MPNGNIHKKGFCPEPPEGCDFSKDRILLHCCCAPCSTAIIEWMVSEGLRPGIFFSNSNIIPFREYSIRRDELVRYAAAHGLETIDDEYDHAAWLAFVRRLESSPAASQTLPVAKQTSPSAERAFPVAECPSLVAERPSLVAECSSPVAEHTALVAEPVEATGFLVRQASPIIESHESLIERSLRQAQGPETGPIGPEANPQEPILRIADMPERGPRCLECFKFRLLRAALYASTHGYTLLTTTLASSRWKDLGQVDAAGRWACETVNGIFGDGCATDLEANASGRNEVRWWNQNWRRGGLQERRNTLIKEWHMYNQTFCGCEFSERHCAGSRVIS